VSARAMVGSACALEHVQRGGWSVCAGDGFRPMQMFKAAVDVLAKGHGANPRLRIAQT
jgi:hypothetical protein